MSIISMPVVGNISIIYIGDDIYNILLSFKQ